jgi:hypothetical protein
MNESYIFIWFENIVLMASKLLVMLVMISLLVVECEPCAFRKEKMRIKFPLQTHVLGWFSRVILLSFILIPILMNLMTIITI